LLTVMAVVAVLSGMLLASVSHAMQRGKRARCTSNLKQIITAAHLYAGDNHGRYSDARAIGTRDVNFLWSYVGRATGTFICPSTRNRVSLALDGDGRVRDLKQLAADRSGVGVSYLLSPFMGWKTPYFTDFPGPHGDERVYSVLKTEATVSSYVHYNTPFNLKGVVPGPTGIFLLTDNTYGGTQDWPDPEDNHGTPGANAVYLDGHAAWNPRSGYVFAHEYSQDDGRSTIEPNR